MLRGQAVALIATIASLALPATGFAQSAGDNQYQDPVTNSGGSSTSGHVTHRGSGGGGTSSGTQSTSSSVPTTSSAGAGTSAQTSGEAASGTRKGQLPRTGFDVILTFELGFAMLLAGLVAQRLIVLREQRDS